MRPSARVILTGSRARRPSWPAPTSWSSARAEPPGRAQADGRPSGQELFNRPSSASASPSSPRSTASPWAVAWSWRSLLHLPDRLHQRAAHGPAGGEAGHHPGLRRHPAPAAAGGHRPGHRADPAPESFIKADQAEPSSDWSITCTSPRSSCPGPARSSGASWSADRSPSSTRSTRCSAAPTSRFAMEGLNLEGTLFGILAGTEDMH